MRGSLSFQKNMKELRANGYLLKFFSFMENECVHEIIQLLQVNGQPCHFE